MESRTASPEELLAHAGWLRRLARRLVDDADDAEELVQETWLAALRRPPRADRSLRPWLARVLTNRVRNARRGDERRGDREELHASAREPAQPDQVVEELEVQRLLVDCVRELAEPERSVIVMRYFRGLDSTAIAARLSIPAGTVRWRIQRGIEELRTRLAARCGGSRRTWSALLLPYSLREVPRGVAVAGGIQGVLAMSVLTKLGVAAAVVAVAGWMWWARDRGSERPTLEDVAAASAEVAEALPEIPLDGAADAPAEVASSRAALASATAPASSSSAVEAPDGPPPPAIVLGSVVDRNGNAVVGAVVAEERNGVLQSCTSGTQGDFELALSPTGLLAWKGALSVSSAGLADVFLDVALESGQTVQVGRIVLAPGSTLHGRVIDPLGAPLAGARVRAVPAMDMSGFDEDWLHRVGLEQVNERPGRAVESGADGTFALPGVGPGRLQLAAQAAATRYGWSEPIEVEEGVDRTDIELVLEPWRREDRIFGRVVDPNGEPVPKATVACRYTGRHESGARTIEAGEDGCFEIVVRGVGAHELVAGDPEDRWSSSAAERVLPGTHDLVLRLGELRVLEVRVRDAAGSAVERFALNPTGLSGYMELCEPEREHPGGIARVRVPGVDFKLQLQAPGYRLEWIGPLAPATTPDHIDVELERLPSIAGRVLAGGEPVAGAGVELMRSLGGWYGKADGFPSRAGWDVSSGARTDAAGHFVLAIEREGECYVRASAAGFAPSEIGPFRLAGNDLPQDLSFELSHGGAIEGRVLLEDGRDATGTIVGVNRGDCFPRTQRAGPGGTFRFENLTPGAYQVVRCDEEIVAGRSGWSSGPEEQAFEASCEVTEGRTTRFDLELRREKE